MEWAVWETVRPLCDVTTFDAYRAIKANLEALREKNKKITRQFAILQKLVERAKTASTDRVSDIWYNDSRNRWTTLSTSKYSNASKTLCDEGKKIDQI